MFVQTFLDRSNDYYQSAAEKWAPIWGGLDTGARYLALEINTYIESIRQDVSFGDGSREVVLQKVWTLTEKSTISEEDATLTAVRKLMYDLFISIPTTFFVKDIQSKSTLDLTKAGSVSDAFWMLVRKTIYVGVMVYLLDQLISRVAVRIQSVPAPQNLIETDLR
ncbi:MAG: hypothetical protein KDK64_00855 [Chlamydiia bacterium]|nr:hypothetical protein [Chlamydiia bacterium]